MKRLAAVVLSETTTLGLRVREERRCSLERRTEEVWVGKSGGAGAPVRVKVADMVPGGGPGGADVPRRGKAEHVDLARIARELGWPLPRAATEAKAAAFWATGDGVATGEATGE